MKNKTLQQLTKEEISWIYHHYMKNDFPSSELKPLNRILELIDNNLCCGIGLLDDDTIRGYALLITPQPGTYCLLDYFAILPSYRGMGYGHAFFSLLPDFLSQNLPQTTGIFIECEAIADAKNTADKKVRQKRISFYENCGCQITNLHSCLFGVSYDILFLSDNMNSENILVPLKHIYEAMFKPHHYKNQVKLWS